MVRRQRDGTWFSITACVVIFQTNLFERLELAAGIGVEELALEGRRDRIQGHTAAIGNHGIRRRGKLLLAAIVRAAVVVC